MTKYLYAVQRKLDGVEVIAAVAEVAKVTEVSVVVDAGRVDIVQGDDVLASSYAGDPPPDLVLARWPVSNLAAKPVIKNL